MTVRREVRDLPSVGGSLLVVEGKVHTLAVLGTSTRSIIGCLCPKGKLDPLINL